MQGFNGFQWANALACKGPLSVTKKNKKTFCVQIISLKCSSNFDTVAWTPGNEFLFVGLRSGEAQLVRRCHYSAY